VSRLLSQDHPPVVRLQGLDLLRGLAMLWMAAYHFCFDLNLMGLWEPRQSFFRDPFWYLQRTGIVSLFLFCVGLSMALALDAGQSWQRFWRRWAQVAVCAALVSLGSALMFPSTWISFGVLHGIAVMLILARLMAPLKNWLWPLGALAMLLPNWLAHPFFDTPYTHWVGLVTRPPRTEDWVPVLPWLGVLLWGLAAGQWLMRLPAQAALVRRLSEVPAWLLPVVRLGQWPLLFYMLHQPILLGGLQLGRSLGAW